MPLRISTLGPFTIQRDDEEIPASVWGNRQTRTILKVLLTRRGHVVSTEQLTDILWPDDDSDAALNRLHVRVSQLRRALDSKTPFPYILTHKGGYSFSLDADCWIDAVEFEARAQWGRHCQENDNLAEAITAYETACTLYRGDFLEEDLYEDWAFVERERLRERFLTTLTELAECYARQGRYRHAIARCRQVLTADCYREAVYVRLMLYHYYAGEQAQALQAYERCRQLLADELGVEPLPDTITLAERIRDGTLWAAECAPHYPPPAYEGRLFEVPYSLGRAPFVGREREYAWLVEKWRDPKTKVILIEGEAGIGKSRLADEFMGYAATEGSTVLHSRMASSGGESPYALLITTLRPLLESRRGENIPPATLAALIPLFPMIRKWYPDLPTLPKLSARREHDRLFEAITALVQAHTPARTHTSAGSLLCVDDAHRAGAATLDLLTHLASDLTIVLVLRSEETPPDHPLRAMLQPLRQQGRAATLILKRLQPTAVQELIHQLAHSDLPTLTEQVITQTDGNPLFVVALLQHLFEEGALFVDTEGHWTASADIPLSLPTTVRETIEARLRRLGRDQRRIFDLAAVIGGEFDFALLQCASEEQEEQLLDTLDVLLEAGLLIEPRAVGRGELALSHSCYAEVAYDTLPQPRRRQLHRRIAKALLGLYRDDPTRNAELAYHHYSGGQSAAAIQFAIRAGEHALHLYVGQQAANHFADAFQWTKEADATLDPEQLAALHVNWATALRRSGQYDDALSHYSIALPYTQGELKQEAIYQICALGAMRGGSLAEFNRLAPTLEQELAGSGDTWALALLRCTQGFLAAFQGKSTRARACTAEGWRIGRRLVARGEEIPALRLARAYFGLARCHEWWADWQRAIRYADKAMALYTIHNDLNGITASHTTLGGAYYGLGEWGQALSHIEQCHSLAADAGDSRAQGEALFQSGLIHLEQGDWTKTEMFARQILVIAEPIGDILRQIFGYFLLARLAIHRGTPQDAIPTLKAIGQLARAADAMTILAQAQPFLAEAHLLAGDVETALTMAREGSNLARQCGLKRERGQAKRILGEALAQSGRPSGAECNFLEALAQAERIGCRYDLAKAQHSLGKLYLEQEAFAKATAHLNAATSIFENLGAKQDAIAPRQLLSTVARSTRSGQPSNE
jgi:DNA-binding SARP family transcriptional activator